MADNRNGSGQVRPVKKADIILKYCRRNSRRLDEAIGVSAESSEEIKQDVSRVADQSEEISLSLAKEVESVKQEMKYLAVQNESIYNAISEKVAALTALLEKAAPEQPQSVAAEIDYDLLADKVARRIPTPQVVSEEAPTQYIAPVNHYDEIDYDLLVDKLVARLPVYDDMRPAENAAPVQQADINYDYLAQRIAQYIPSQGNNYSAVAVPSASVDADYLADKVVSRMPVQEVVSPDYIAAKVAEQLVAPKTGEVDYDYLAEKVASRISVPAAVVGENVQASVDADYLAEKVAEKLNVTATIADSECDYIADKVAEKVVIPESRDMDYDYLAQRVAEKVVIPESRNTYGAAYAPAPSGYDINEDELADAIALKVGSLKPEDFEILVDDDGCRSLSKEITDNFNYALIADTVANKLRDFLEAETESEPDYEEMAQRISEKITVAGINEDAIADKAAAALSNYLPEFDNDEIADKVAEQIISAMPAVDHDTLSENISSKLIESQKDNDYEIVLDEDGLDRMSDSVSEKVYNSADERFNNIDREIAEIKEMLAKGVQVVRDETASTAVYEDSYVTEETLVTVSDLIKEDYTEEEVKTEEQVSPAETVAEEPAAEEVETQEDCFRGPEEKEEEKIAPIPVPVVIESDDEDVELPDEDDAEGGVDFANMMKYNRSFIARIIQSTDEQKRYYGEVRNALLSYKRVNSNIAWGAERFHKGRETIARFKIRGKTLVMYLALDPATHEYSVYHHKDVSDNKSLHGTPMMIKIMSPRGVKKAVRLIDEMLAARDGIKRNVPTRDYAAMYPYETMEELIEDGLVKDVNKK